MTRPPRSRSQTRKKRDKLDPTFSCGKERAALEVWICTKDFGRLSGTAILSDDPKSQGYLHARLAVAYLAGYREACAAGQRCAHGVPQKVGA